MADNKVVENNSSIAAPVTFTQGAMEEIKRLIEHLNITGEQALRIGVKGGGCSGMSYLIAFDTVGEKDDVYEIDGIKVCMEKIALMYLLGMEIDYENGLNSRGFVFNNPNAVKTCGCGTSFAA